MNVKLLAQGSPSMNWRWYSVLWCCSLVFLYRSAWGVHIFMVFWTFSEATENTVGMVMAFEERAPFLEGQPVSLICESSQDSSGLWEMTELAGDPLHTPGQVGCEAIGLCLWSVITESRAQEGRFQGLLGVGSWPTGSQLSSCRIQVYGPWKQRCWPAL